MIGGITKEDATDGTGVKFVWCGCGCVGGSKHSRTPVGDHMLGDGDRASNAVLKNLNVLWEGCCEVKWRY